MLSLQNRKWDFKCTILCETTKPLFVHRRWLFWMYTDCTQNLTSGLRNTQYVRLIILLSLVLWTSPLAGHSSLKVYLLLLTVYLAWLKVYLSLLKVYLLLQNIGTKSTLVKYWSVLEIQKISSHKNRQLLSLFSRKVGRNFFLSEITNQILSICVMYFKSNTSTSTAKILKLNGWSLKDRIHPKHAHTWMK